MNLPDGRNPRGRGAIAGLVPTLVIALLFAVGGTSATPLEVAWSLTLVALIAMTAVSAWVFFRSQREAGAGA